MSRLPSANHPEVSVNVGYIARTLGLGLLLSFGGACADPVTPDPSAVPATPVTTNVGILRVVTPGLVSGAQTGGTVRLRPCNITSCPFALGSTAPQFVLSASGSTDLVVPVGSYAVDFEPPSAHSFAGSYDTLGALVVVNSPTTVTFAVTPSAER